MKKEEINKPKRKISINKPKRKISINKVRISRDTENLNNILIENFVKLQKAVTNLAGKFDDLSIQISKLLQLFEISAKSFADRISLGVPEIEKDKEFLDKLNKLLEQNKTIAKGLTLMEEKIRERVYGMQRKPMMSPRPQPQYMMPISQAPSSTEGYMPSSLEQKKKTREIQ